MLNISVIPEQKKNDVMRWIIIIMIIIIIIEVNGCELNLSWELAMSLKFKAKPGDVSFYK